MVVAHGLHRIYLTLEYSCKYQSHAEICEFQANRYLKGAIELITYIYSENERNVTVKDKHIFSSKIIYFLLRFYRSMEFAKNDYELLCMITARQIIGLL